MNLFDNTEVVEFSPLPHPDGNTFAFELPSGKWCVMPIQMFEVIKSKINRFRLLQQDFSAVNWRDEFEVECGHPVYYNINGKLIHKTAILFRRKNND